MILTTMTAGMTAGMIGFTSLNKPRIRKHIKKVRAIHDKNTTMEYTEMIVGSFEDAGRDYHLNPYLLVAVAWQESDFVNSVHDATDESSVGIMQIQPSTMAKLSPLNGPWDEERILRRPDHAVSMAAKYLRRNYARFGTMPLALAAYNTGPTRLAERIRDYKDDNPGDQRVRFDDIQNRLPEITAEYVPAVVEKTGEFK